MRATVRSTLSLGAGLALVSGALTVLWMGYGPGSQGVLDQRTTTVIPLSQQSRSGLDANGQPIRVIAPGLPSVSGMAGKAPTSP